MMPWDLFVYAENIVHHISKSDQLNFLFRFFFFNKLLIISYRDQWQDLRECHEAVSGEV